MPSKSVESCTFGSNHCHVVYEMGNQDDSLFNFLYVPAAIPCLLNWFKLLILPTQKNSIKSGPIIPRLHVAVDYPLKSNHLSTNKTRKKNVQHHAARAWTQQQQLLRLLSTVRDETMRRFCQLMLDEHCASIYQIMDILLCDQGIFGRETSSSLPKFHIC